LDIVARGCWRQDHRIFARRGGPTAIEDGFSGGVRNALESRRREEVGHYTMRVYLGGGQGRIGFLPFGAQIRHVRVRAQRQGVPANPVSTSTQSMPLVRMRRS